MKFCFREESALAPRWNILASRAQRDGLTRITLATSSCRIFSTFIKSQISEVLQEETFFLLSLSLCSPFGESFPRWALLVSFLDEHARERGCQSLEFSVWQNNKKREREREREREKRKGEKATNSRQNREKKNCRGCRKSRKRQETKEGRIRGVKKKRNVESVCLNGPVVSTDGKTKLAMLARVSFPRVFVRTYVQGVPRFINKQTLRIPHVRTNPRSYFLLLSCHFTARGRDQRLALRIK